MSVAILCPAACNNDVINKAGICGINIQYLTSEPFPTLQWWFRREPKRLRPWELESEAKKLLLFLVFCLLPKLGVNQNGRALWELKFEEKLIASLYIYFVFVFVCFCLFIAWTWSEPKWLRPWGAQIWRRKKILLFLNFVCLLGLLCVTVDRRSRWRLQLDLFAH